MTKIFQGILKIDERGNAIIAVMVLSLVAGILFSGVMNFLMLRNRAISEAGVKRMVLNLRSSALGTMGDQVNWQVIMQKNESMACLRAHTCQNGQTATETAPAVGGSGGSEGSPGGRQGQRSGNGVLYSSYSLTRHPASTGVAPPVPPQTPLSSNFALYDSAGARIYDPSSDPTAGFDFKGKVCRGFDLRGNDDCPIRMDLHWLPSCANAVHPGSCFTPEEVVAVSFTYAPKSPQFKFSFNPANYNYVSERLYLGTNLPLLRCAQIGKRFIGNLAGGVTGFNGFNSDAAGCAPYAAFQGPTGATGATGPTGAVGPMGPQGPPPQSPPPPPPVIPVASCPGAPGCPPVDPCASFGALANGCRVLMSIGRSIASMGLDMTGMIYWSSTVSSVGLATAMSDAAVIAANDNAIMGTDTVAYMNSAAASGAAAGSAAVDNVYSTVWTATGMSGPPPTGGYYAPVFALPLP